MRFVIVGNSGSGKSTLARFLSDKYGTAHLDLDSIVWEPGRIAVRRDTRAMEADVARFVGENEAWVVEGCYGELIGHVLAHDPTLLFLNPGVDICLKNNESRPWEPHKYESKAAQDSMLANLQSWVRGYYERDDDWSLAAHRRLFENYSGAKKELRQQVDLSLF